MVDSDITPSETADDINQADIHEDEDRKTSTNRNKQKEIINSNIVIDFIAGEQEPEAGDDTGTITSQVLVEGSSLKSIGPQDRNENESHAGLTFTFSLLPHGPINKIRHARRILNKLCFK